MKKYLFMPVLLMLLSFTVPVKKQLSQAEQSKSKIQLSKKLTIVPRVNLVDLSGNYMVYIESDAGYDGNFGGGNVTIVVQNLATSVFMPTTSKLGYISASNYVGQSPFNENPAKCRFMEDGVQLEIFFGGS